MTHILMLVVFGLAGLAAFVAAAAIINRAGHRMDGARLFVWVWLLAAILNGAAGVIYAHIPVINEVGAFIPIFGVPAAAAWYLSRRFRATHGEAVRGGHPR